FIAISNIYGGEGHFPLAQVALIEIVLTALFLIVIVSVTLPKAPVGFAPIAIGLTLTFIHLVAIPVDNASVNPARSTATAIFGGPPFSAAAWRLGRFGCSGSRQSSAASSVDWSLAGCKRNRRAQPALANTSIDISGDRLAALKARVPTAKLFSAAPNCLGRRA